MRIALFNVSSHTTLGLLKWASRFSAPIDMMVEEELILLTGASRGIGSYLLRRFLDDGEKVAGTYCNTEPGTDVRPFLSHVDVTDYSEVEAWISSAIDLDPRVVLINCAGVNYNSFAHKADVAKWSRIIQVNLIGSFNTSRAVLPHMRDVGWGRIINVSSVVAQQAVPGTTAYAASKAGLWGLTRALAQENAQKGISVNAINLGYFQIGMIDEIPATFQSQLKERIPTGVFGEPADILRMIRFLIQTPYVNGSALDMNGAIS